MKIVLMEPLGIEKDTLDRLAAGLTKEGHDFTAYDTFSTDVEELTRRSSGADVLIIANHPLPGEVIQADPNLKFISVAFVGIDHVDVDACKAQNIKISNTGGYCNDAVQTGKGKAGLQGHELAGRTVGIIGTGAIGCRTAEIFKAFGCRLIGYSHSRKQAALDLGLEYKTLDEVMKEADIVSIHTPLTPETKGLIGGKEIEEMKQGAILINTSRGPVVDTDALADALRKGRIKAGIDVFEKDPPLPAGHPLLGAPNLVCTPHVVYDTREASDRRAVMAFENVTSWIGGKQIRTML